MFLLETHSSGVKAKNQIKKLGFSGSHIVDSRGQSGGIWCVWDKAVWSVDEIESSHQFVHLQVAFKGQLKWLITVVYASMSYVRRQQLWADLNRIAESHDTPWAVLGHFNCILADSERKGGASNPADRDREDFRRMLHDCNLIDAGFQGSPFTWRSGNLFQHLDRILINMQWRLHFSQAAVFHLPYFKSDHKAVLMQMKRKNGPNRRRRPFRFEAAWLMHSDFPNLMRKNWTREEAWGSQLSRFQQEVIKWNKVVFGNIFTRKKMLISRLNDVDNQLAVNMSPGLEDLKASLWCEYEHVLQ